MPKHLAIACGGTGGHFFPTLAIAKAFLAEGHKVTLLISGKNAKEQMKTAEQYQIPARETLAIRRPSSFWSLCTFPFQMLACLRKAKRILKEVNPDLLLGMGSYASFPVCYACPKTIPLVLHEGNAFMGKTNRMLIRKAKAIGLSLPLAIPEQLQNTPSEIVGMPLREAVVNAALSGKGTPGYLTSLGLQENCPTLLVFGGSLGAQFINNLLLQAAPLLPKEIQIIHLTGTDDNAALVEAYRKAALRASVRRAESHIEECYLASQLVLCRGGASTLCELALFGKPAIILPLPSAADDHQTFNAKLASSLQGAIHLPQNEATPEKVADLCQQLIANPQQFQSMGERLKKLATPNAAQSMAKLIASLQ